MRTRLLTLVLTLVLGTAQAACEAELRQLERGLPAGMPAGSRAAQLLYGAVELIEPALPAWRHQATVPLAAAEAGYGAVNWLVGRDLLPDEWRRDRLDEDVWLDMLSSFLDWYDIEPLSLPVSTADPVADLARVLDLVGKAVRPVAVIAHDENQEVSFVGVIWNWSSYPRLLVSQLEPGTSVAGGTDAVLAELGNCAVTVDRYALAPAATAWRLFVGTGESTMFVLASEPARPHLPLAVSQDEVLEFLQFQADDVAGTGVFSAAFSGQEIGFGAILSMVAQIRTNVSPLQLNRYLQVPPRLPQ